MNVSEEKDDGVSASERRDRQTGDESSVKPERPDSWGPSGVSLKSHRSISRPTNFKNEEPTVEPRPQRKESEVLSERPEVKHYQNLDSVLAKENDDGVSASELQDSQTGDESPVKPERPDSWGPSGVSLKSHRSISRPTNFKNEEPTVEPRPQRKESEVLSERPKLKHYQNLDSVLAKENDDGVSASELQDSQTGDESPVKPERPDSWGPSGVSLKSHRSISRPTNFKNEEPTVEPRPHRKRSEVLSERPELKCHQNLDSVFEHLEENIVTFVKNELKKFKKVLDPENPQFLKGLEEDDEVVGDEEQRNSNREAILKLSLNFLRNMEEKQLADSLQSKTHAAIGQRKLKSKLKDKCQCLFEGIAKAGNPTLLNQIYTTLYITEAESGEVNDLHEFRQIEAASQKTSGSETTFGCEDIFKPLPGRDEPVRTLVTKGVAGIGKTVLTQKYTLDWAEDKANSNIQFVFPFSFRELNLLREKKYSLVELLHQHFIEIKEAGICKFEKFQVLFIFDGLDECRLPLDFNNNRILNDVTESTSVDVLLTNLIKGNLLPFARLWITTRPAAANQIPPKCVDMVTEVRGFSDPQKEEYFRKRFRDNDHAGRLISHIEASRSLHNMCHIPVFCWITATVLDHVLRIREEAELPKTLTEMYIHFLVVQTKQRNAKYHGSVEADPVWNTETKKTTLTLGKLAFEQLEKGNLIFYEADLRECGIELEAASVHSGLFTEILKDERGLSQEKVFCFVHLSVQEFLAALYVFLTFINTGINLLRRRRFNSVRLAPLQLDIHISHLCQKAVDKALESPNGHLDLFVRFLLGLSLKSNQTLLQGLLKTTGRKLECKEMLVQHIKKKIKDSPSPEKSINLFHCLNELDDRSLVDEIQQYLRSGCLLGKKLSSSQWSALVFILLSSQKDLDVFDLSKFSTSEEGFLKLLPVVKASKKALLSGCNLSPKSCEALASVFITKKCSLRELDMSHNDLQDLGVKLLSSGLRSPLCRLEVLRLSGCQVTEKGCTFLASALRLNPFHLRELDLSFNHPEDSGVTMLSAALNDPSWKLETLKIDHCGKHRLYPAPLRYFCELSLNPNTADRNLSLSDDNKRVVVVREKQPYPDQPGRFDSWRQLLCREGLTGRCYWEVRWKGRVHIGVTYRGINRRGDRADCCIGWNDRSWSLFCSAHGYTAWHNHEPKDVAAVLLSDSNRVAVYLDWPAGTLSFYLLPSIVSSAEQIHLYTFKCTFTEPLYPAFGFGRIRELETGSRFLPSSVVLSQMGE